MATRPPIIMTTTKGSFSRKAIEERKPLIIDQILSDYDYTPTIRQDLINLKKELIDGTVQPLLENTTDKITWNKDMQPWLGKSWLDIPWLLAESFFFRRVLEAVKFFQPGVWMHKDPYERLKYQETVKSLTEFTQLGTTRAEEKNLENFQMHCHRSLWGNRGDLSNMDTFDAVIGDPSKRVIIDQTREVFQFLSHQPAKVAFFHDNVGKELLFDLAFIDFLIRTGLTQSITCFLKNQPFFVSDAMIKDFISTINFLSTSPSEDLQRLAHRLTKMLNSGQIILETPPFLTTGCTYEDLPEVLKSQLSSHDLAILKGDLNFRRLVGDRQWDPTTTIETACGYFPTSFLSLRLLKSELIVGVSEQFIEKIAEEAEADWLINAKWGMITFHEKS